MNTMSNARRSRPGSTHEAPPRPALRGLLLVVLALAFTGSAFAQAAGTLEVRLSREIAKLGEPVQIIIVASSIDGAAPEVQFRGVPKVAGVQVGQPRGAGTSSIAVNDARGRMRRQASATFVIPLQASAVGEYEIPPLELRVDGEDRTAPAAPMKLKVVQDIRGEELLLFERDEVPARVYEGEPLTLTLRFGWLASMTLEDIALYLPWWERLDGLIRLDSAPKSNEVAVPVRSGAESQTNAERLDRIRRDGNEFFAFRIERRYLPTRAGTLAFDGSVLRFVERRPRSLRGEDYYRPLEDFSIEVVPLPEEGRPFDFTGAVGHIDVAADAPRRDVDAGDVLTLQLRYSGTGNLEFFDAPKLERQPGFEDFRVLGVRDEKGPYERVITYDLVPRRATIEAIPEVALPVFDPREGRYTSVVSKLIPIRVTASADGGDDPFGAEAPDAAPAEDILAPLDIDATPVADEVDAGPEPERGPRAPLTAGLLVAALVGTTLLRRRVGAHRDPSSRAARRRRAALGRLARDLRTTDGSPAARADAFDAFLAARTDTVPGAWVGVLDLTRAEDELERAPSAGLAADFQAVRATLDGARFGGRAAAGSGDDDVLRVARALVKEGVL